MNEILEVEVLHTFFTNFIKIISKVQAKSSLVITFKINKRERDMFIQLKIILF